MQRATLYLLVGYPGSGKTTTSEIIHELTGAVHIWADIERARQFGRPSHSEAESIQLYQRLNAEAEQLLSQGQSVVFDTSFNHRRDRDLLRGVAAKYGADVRVVQIQTPLEVAAERALSSEHFEKNGHLDTMTPEVFARVAGNLEPPTPDEQPVILDGQQITKPYVAQLLGLGGANG